MHLEGLNKLETLYLCVPVTDVGLRSLKKLTSLEHLYIGDVDEDAYDCREFLSANLLGVLVE